MISTSHGRKIFFVYPHSVVKNELINVLINQEYEVYLINDHSYLKAICEKYVDPIIFINIDEGQTALEWETLIRELKDGYLTHKAQFGIFTYDEDEKVSQKFLMDVMITCGYITLKLGIEESTEIIIKTLEVNEAKGQRKILGTKCNPNESTLNFRMGDSHIQGNIISISSIGMSVIFSTNLILPTKINLTNIQLKLKGVLVNVSAIIIGVQKSTINKNVYLLVFNKNISLESRTKIRQYICKILQQQIEEELGHKLLQWQT